MVQPERRGKGEKVKVAYLCLRTGGGYRMPGTSCGVGSLLFRLYRGFTGNSSSLVSERFQIEPLNDIGSLRLWRVSAVGWLHHARKNCGLLTVIVLGVEVTRDATVIVSLTDVVVARTT